MHVLVRYGYSRLITEPDDSLVGRENERRVIESLIGAARNGISGALVLYGEAGVGKSRLLAFAEGAAGGAGAANSAGGGMAVAALSGAELELPFSFAAVQRLLLPYRDGEQDLPAGQRAALSVAFGRAEGPAPDRYLVGLATLSLLARAAEDRPLLVCLDDAQWFDPESRAVLAFVARRLHAEGIALLLAVRDEGAPPPEFTGLPIHDLRGLDAAASAALLARSVPHAPRRGEAGGEAEPVAAPVAARIARTTQGNPLAIIDLARELSAPQLTGTAELPDPVPVGEHLERHYLRRVRTLPADVQDWLLVASAEGLGDLSHVTAAASQLGLATNAAVIAENAGLVATGTPSRSLVFRHPLVRSAIYNGASGADRRRAHTALARTLTGVDAADQRALHRAAATVGTDDAVAAVVEAAADRAGQRGGFTSRARLLMRSVELTPEGDARRFRVLLAAEAAAAAGAATLTLRLLDEVESPSLVPLDPVLRGRVLVARALVQNLTGEYQSAARVPGMLLDAAREFGSADPVRAKESLLRCAEAMLYAHWGDGRVTFAGLAAAIEGALDPRDESVAATVLRAVAAYGAGPYASAVPLMRAALRRLDSDELSDADRLRFGFLGVLVTLGLWDEAACIRILRRSSEVARAAGALNALDSVLWVRSMAKARFGHLHQAEALLAEVGQLRPAIGFTPELIDMYKNASYLGWRGGGDDVRTQIAVSRQAAEVLGFGGAVSAADVGTALLDLADGRYAAAHQRLSDSWQRWFLQDSDMVLPQIVEAAVRSNNTDVATEACARLAEIAAASDSAWARGAALTARALLASDDEVEGLYRAAIAALSPTEVRSDLAMAHLLFGEWLRRVRRRREGAEQLVIARDLFEAMGATGFAARAGRELAVLGVEPGPAAEAPGAHPAHPALTAQEATIAALAADGATNAEIAEALFISANTVDYHLRKVFRKLGVSSRRQLSRATHPSA